jgi:hypothetical protein
MTLEIDSIIALKQGIWGVLQGGAARTTAEKNLIATAET